MSKQKIIILASVFVDVLGFGIVIPILPYYLTEFGATALTITMLFSVYSLCAFLSAPFLGALSDRIGRRPVILVSIASTSIGWFVFAGAATIPLLFIGRIIDGLAAGNFSSAQSYLVDISGDDEKERVKNLGIIGATFGIGFILGPMVGGIFSKISHAAPFYLAGGMAFVNLVFAFFFLTESNHHRSTTPLRYNPFLPLKNAYQNIALRPLYLKWFFFALSFVIAQTTFSLFTQKAFNYTALQTGLLFTALGVIVAINQTVLLNTFWTKYFTNLQLERIMFGITLIGLALVATQNLILFYISLPFAGTSQAVYRVVVANEALKRVEPTRKGEVMGMVSSVVTAAMIISPIAGGILFQQNISYPFIAGMAFVSTAIFISVKK